MHGISVKSKELLVDLRDSNVLRCHHICGRVQKMFHCIEGLNGQSGLHLLEVEKVKTHQDSSQSCSAI